MRKLGKIKKLALSAIVAGAAAFFPGKTLSEDFSSGNIKRYTLDEVVNFVNTDKPNYIEQLGRDIREASEIHERMVGDVGRRAKKIYEDVGRDYISASEIHEKIAGDLGKRTIKGLNSIPEDIKAPLKDTIGLVFGPGGGAINTLIFDVYDTATTPNDDLRKIKGIDTLTGFLIKIPGTNTLNRIVWREFEKDLAIPEPYIFTQQDIGRFQNFPSGIMEDVTIQKFKNGKIISTKHYETLDFNKWTEQLQEQQSRIQEQSLRDNRILQNALYQEQYQSQQFKMPQSSLRVEQPSIDTQTYKLQDLYSMPDNWKSHSSSSSPTSSLHDLYNRIEIVPPVLIPKNAYQPIDIQPQIYTPTPMPELRISRDFIPMQIYNPPPVYIEPRQIYNPPPHIEPLRIPEPMYIPPPMPLPQINPIGIRGF